MLSDLAIRLRSLFRRATVNQELDEELRFHLQQQSAKYVRAGLTSEEAMRRAQLEFGGLDQIKVDCREARGVTLVETIAQDVRYGLRMLLKSPGFTAVVVLTLALGIGANTAIFTLVNAVMLRALPVQDPEQLVVLQWTAHNGPGNIGMSSFGDCADLQKKDSNSSGCSLTYPMFKAIRSRKDVFSNVTAFAGTAQMNVSGIGSASTAQGELVSGDYFETLGVRPALGRTLEPDDEKPGAAPVLVLDYGYWQRAFGGATNVVGRTIRLNNAVFTIVGVADRGFTRLTPGKSVDLWVSLIQTTPLEIPWSRGFDAGSWWLTVVARLKPGVTRAQAQAAINPYFVNETLHGAKPAWKKADDPSLMLVPAQDGLAGIRSHYGQPLLLLMGAVGIVLLIACANVAGLMLARGATREKEMAVRLALGAARGRVVRQLLTESLLLSIIGAALGALLAYAGASGLAAFFAENAYSPLKIDLHPNLPVLLFAIGMALLTGIGFGLAPAFRGARANVVSELKGASAATTASRHRTGRVPGLGSGLVVLQVALSMVVLTGAGLLLRTLDKLRGIDPGFDTRNVLLFSLDPESAGYKEQQTQSLYQNLQQRLQSLPGVVAASYSSDALLDGGLWTSGVRVQGQADKKTVQTQMLAVGPDYFTAMRIPLFAGRILRTADMGSAQRNAIVNQAFVQRFVGARNPIGLTFGGDDPKAPQYRIVGVVGDTKYANLRMDNAPTAFIPLQESGATFAVRTAAAPAILIPAVRSVVNQIDSSLPLTGMRTQSETIDRLLFNERLVARLFGLFAALGLVLACIGLYGLLSYEVARRTREIGIRTALGAQRQDVLVMVLRQGLLLVICGAVVGTGAAMVVTRLLVSLLYNVQPYDPGTLVAVAVLLVAVGVVACSIPARRATRVDPMVALRYE